ncbi:hypothetical protein A5482_015725 (plasmid) [Cyanobacterium sp. IPPAS B-1200]|uniref:hypothetical protein n=1 Tax=Cyanobacterium sp. IPPAS B-1200 TaxID=1562720 RepID=UPI0008526C86|nr:hypothetical protein [Cyanobacterium sp. IPPAS B-1200]OEJ78536.1 hypothetical protein A5482_12545 [Cyanobacterium sp. IPPAS B-1200]
MKQNSEFKRYNTIWAKIFYRFGLIEKSINVPLFGVKGAGKSYFLLSLGMFLSTRKLGKPEAITEDLLNQYWAEILKGNLISITQGKWDVDLLVKQIYSKDHKISIERQTIFQAGGVGSDLFLDDEEQFSSDSDKLSTRIFLRTNDISGQEFTLAMNQLSEPTIELGGDPITKKFIQVVRDGNGAVMVIDLVRKNCTAEQYRQNRDKYVREAFGEQLVPLARGLELALRNQRDPDSRYPLFLVFPKRDIHRLNSQELNDLAQRMFAMTFARLEEKVSIHIHSIQNMGFEKDEKGDLTFSKGLGLFLADIYSAFR